LGLLFEREKGKAYFLNLLSEPNKTCMGSINRFNLKRIKKHFKTDCFFETGTWKGDAVQFALDSGFNNIISTEIIPELASNSRSRFLAFPNVQIITGDSVTVLRNQLQGIDCNCTFWLDAHFPGADAGINKYEDELNEDLRLPLGLEICAISELRKLWKDVIIVDDLRIYEDGHYENGAAPADVLPKNNRNTDFIVNAFKNTHHIHRLYMDEGYLLLLPKKRFSSYLMNLFDYKFAKNLLNPAYFVN
jgi:hypothetical protein